MVGVADSAPCCSPASAFTTATGIRCPSPLAEQPPQPTPRARRARGVSRSRGPTAKPRGEPPMSTTAELAEPVTDPAARIGELRGEIDACDGEIIELIQRRLSISREIGALREAAGG